MDYYYTTSFTCDGFGSQAQKNILTFIFCDMNDYKFVYTPFKEMEHNYENDDNYLNKMENLLNFKNEIKNVSSLNNNDKIFELDYVKLVIPFINENIDQCIESDSINKIKKIFWNNK